MNSPKIIPSVLPPNYIKPLSTGSTNIYTSVSREQAMNNETQNNLVNGYQGGKKYKKGGSHVLVPPQVLVPTAPSYAVDKTATNANYAALASLAEGVKNDGVFDTTGTGNQVDVAKLSAAQNNVYNGTGGKRKRKRRHRHTKKGGTNWTCMSGGTRSKYKSKSKKCKCRKCRKTRTHKRKH